MIKMILSRWTLINYLNVTQLTKVFAPLTVDLKVAWWLNESSWRKTVMSWFFFIVLLLPPHPIPTAIAKETGNHSFIRENNSWLISLMSKKSFSRLIHLYHSRVDSRAVAWKNEAIKFHEIIVKMGSLCAIGYENYNKSSTFLSPVADCKWFFFLLSLTRFDWQMRICVRKKKCSFCLWPEVRWLFVPPETTSSPNWFR